MASYTEGKLLFNAQSGTCHPEATRDLMVLPRKHQLFYLRWCRLILNKEWVVGDNTNNGSKIEQHSSDIVINNPCGTCHPGATRDLIVLPRKHQLFYSRWCRLIQNSIRFNSRTGSHPLKQPPARVNTIVKAVNISRACPLVYK